MSAEDWEGVREAKKARKASKYDRNIDILIRSRLSFIARNNDSEFFIKQEGKPDVVFWPTTDKWRISGAVGKAATFFGNAESFLKWYAKAEPVKATSAKYVSELQISAKSDYADKIFALELEHERRNNG